MNVNTKTIAAVLCIAVLAVSPATADTICWTGAETTVWGNRLNWDDCEGRSVQNFPGADDKAIIKADAEKICEVQNAAGRSVGTLIVEDDDVILLSIGADDHWSAELSVFDHMEVAGTIQILQGCTLELRGTTTSTIYGGSVEFWYAIPVGGSCDGDPHGTIQIKENTTIEGDDGQIIGRACTGPGLTRGIIATDFGKRLTVRKRAVGGDFTIHGYLDIQALMTNESALVGTDANADVMRLSTYDKDGDNGSWFCDAGELHVDKTITGKNLWDMIGANSFAELHFESGSDCTCLEGDFDIRGGTVFLKDDVCTTGTTRVKSEGGSAPSIIASTLIDGSFAGTCAGCGF